MSSTTSTGSGFLARKPYDPPSWASHLHPIPHRLPRTPSDSDSSVGAAESAAGHGGLAEGMQLNGNKVRKLEFLLADAVAQGADSIITIGGIQSNHCRATAVAAKYLGLDCCLILRTSKVRIQRPWALTDLLKEKLLKKGRRPYVIPVGGSNSLGTWGYIEAIREIEKQLLVFSQPGRVDDIMVACGIGGTIAGLSLGLWLGSLKAKVLAFSVCDDPEYFYSYVQGLIDRLGAGVSSHDIVTIQNAKGLGYAMNTIKELKFVKEVAQATGVILDPVCSGKAAYALLNDMAEHPQKWDGRKILFIQTGGLLGLYDTSVRNRQRMELRESIPRADGIGKMFLRFRWWQPTRSKRCL
ncbi:D-cysteine desulfhydrase 1, mitochondrial-like protein [Drosera capensis]